MKYYLIEEVRALATRAKYIMDNKETGARVRDDRLKGAAASAKAKARTAAAKDPAKAEKLDEKLGAIDDKRNNARLELWGADADLNLPTAPIVDAPPARPLPPDYHPILEHFVGRSCPRQIKYKGFANRCQVLT